MSDNPPVMTEQDKQQQQQQQKTEDMVTIPRRDYESLVKASMMTLQNEFDTMNDYDTFMTAAVNFQMLVMSRKEAKKRAMTGKDNNPNSDVKQQQQ